MNMRLATATLVAGLALTGCTAGTVSSLGPRDQLLPKVATMDERLPPEAYLDGTGPVSATQLAARRPATQRPRALASAPASRIGTDGISSAAKTTDIAPFSPEWWEKENREDERLRNRMTICRGC